VSFLRKQESRLLVPAKSPSPSLAEGQDALSRRGRGGLFHSAKMLPFDLSAILVGGIELGMRF